MATSGTSVFTVTRDEIIAAALREIEVIDPEETPTANQVTDAAKALNTIIKRWTKAQGQPNLWARDTVEFPLETASSEVTGTDGEVYTCIKGHTAVNGDHPITGSNWSSKWRLRGSTGGAWATTAYTAIGEVTLAADTVDISRVLVRENGVDVPVQIIGKDDYNLIHDKSDTGKPLVVFPDFQMTGDVTTTAKFFLWPQPAVTTYLLHWDRTRKLEDFTASSDNADMPVWWIDALELTLAYKLSRPYGLTRERRKELRELVAEALGERRAMETETTGGNFVESAYSDTNLRYRRR